MNKIIIELTNIGCDMEAALNRFLGDENMLLEYLHKFVNDKSFTKMSDMIKEGNIHEAFKFAHMIKGLAGNLELKRLYNKISILVESLRNEDTSCLSSQFLEVSNAYYEVVSIVGN